MTTPISPSHFAGAPHAARAAWMRVLALAESSLLDDAFVALGNDVPTYTWLRAPQTGMAMVRGRAGGTGEQFNLGEMTITRCALTLPDGTIGMAYVQGRDARHAEQAAMLDGLLQQDAWHDRVRQAVIDPLAQAHYRQADQKSKVAAQTKVEFFTLVRGED